MAIPTQRKNRIRRTCWRVMRRIRNLLYR